jgi:hypothetical protein
MTVERVSQDALLKRVDAVGGEIKFLKRDLLRSLATRSQINEAKPSLFGSVRGGDVTEDMIEEAKLALFRPVDDVGNDG